MNNFYIPCVPRFMCHRQEKRLRTLLEVVSARGITPALIAADLKLGTVQQVACPHTTMNLTA